MVNQEKKLTSLFNPVQLWKSGGNFIVKCGHTCTDLGIPIAGEVERREELKNLLQQAKFFTHLQNKKYQQIEQSIYVIVNEAIWNNPFGVDVPLMEKPGG